MSTITFTVHGTPAPQGSKKGFYNHKIGRVQMVESSNKVKPWRQDVKHAALDRIASREGTGEPFTTLDGPVHALISFYLPRPKGHYGTGRNAAVLKPSAPARPSTKPDVDKLVRSTLDALKEAGVYSDDSQVVELHTAKWYADDRPPGATIDVTAIEPVQHTPADMPPAQVVAGGLF